MDMMALASFNLVAMHGGFGRASRATGRPKATMSRHVAELEEQLDVRLIERSGRTFKLTEAGAALHARTEGLLLEIAEVGRELSEGQRCPRGRLRISSPVTFGQTKMGRIAAEFSRRYPDVQVEVTIEDRLVDMIEEGYDAVIRVNPKPNHDFVGRCFHRDELLVIAAPTLGRPSSVTEAEASAPVPAIVGLAAPEIDHWTMRDGDCEMRLSRKAVLRLPTPLMVRDAALTGIGAAILARGIVSDDIASGRLVCWGVVPDSSVALWVMHTSRRLVSSKVSAFVQFICDADPYGTRD
ncbi:MAG: LysR family transcriptional regulator [Hyphomicrobiales bacterium]|nr:LysR family transcriptional regulator [Hyphomicrobiales bacterium]